MHKRPWISPLGVFKTMGVSLNCMLSVWPNKQNFALNSEINRMVLQWFIVRDFEVQT